MLGICVVYLFPDDQSLALLDLSVSHLRRLTSGPYRLYATGLRLSELQQRQVESHNIDLIDLPDSGMVGGIEHSACLDLLFDAAFSDGCTKVATFDTDSWPVSLGWDRVVTALVDDYCPVVGIVRAELADNFPLGAFSLVDRSFWRIGVSSFSTRLRSPAPPEICKRISRPGETGAGILAQSLADRRPFRALHKSNAWSPHPVMGALYGDLFFHLGAGSRQPTFITDKTQYGSVTHPLHRKFRDQVNGAIRHFLLEELVTNPDALYGALSPTWRDHAEPGQDVATLVLREPWTD